MKKTREMINWPGLMAAGILLVFGILSMMTVICPEATAEEQSGCFTGKDHLGFSAKVYVKYERYGHISHIEGQIYSEGENRVFKFKADGYSGAGRLFVGHEYETGALYIKVKKLTESDFVLEVESHGVFSFQRTPC